MSSRDPPPAPKVKAGRQPHAPRSPFVCFSHSKKQAFKNKIDEEKHLQQMASDWNELTDRERAEWDEVARKDKLRYLRERELNKGTTAAPKRRAKKDPNAPRRPMSAFLAFSQAKRLEMKTNNPALSNTDISRLLGSIWKTAPMAEKARFIEAEKLQREGYKEKMRVFRLKQSNVPTPESQVSKTNQPMEKSPSSAFEHFQGNRKVFRSYHSCHPFDNGNSHSQRKTPQYSLHYGDQPVFPRHKVNMDTPLFVPRQHAIVTAPPSFSSPQPGETTEIHRAGSDLTRFDALYAGVFGSFMEDDPDPEVFNTPEQESGNGSHYFADVFNQP